MRGVAEHMVPSYVPQARGQITHYVCYDYPRCRGDKVTRSEEVPCVGLSEAHRIAEANKSLRMQNVRVVTWAEKHSQAVQS